MLIHIPDVVVGCIVTSAGVCEVARAVVAAAVVVAVVVDTTVGSVKIDNDIEIDMLSSGTPNSLAIVVCGREVVCGGMSVGIAVVSIAGMVAGKTGASGALIDNSTTVIGSDGAAEEVIAETVAGMVMIGGVRMGGRLKPMDNATTGNSVGLIAAPVGSVVPSKMFPASGCNWR